MKFDPRSILEGLLALALGAVVFFTLSATAGYAREVKDASAPAASLAVDNFVDIADTLTDVVSSSGLAFTTMDLLSGSVAPARLRPASLHLASPSSAAQSFETACPGGGSVKMSTRDADNSGDLSTRDRFVTVFDACMLNGKLVSGRGEFVVASHRFEGHTEVTELDFRFKDLGSSDLRWSGPAHVSLHSDLRRGTERYTVSYRDLVVTRGERSMRWNFALELVRPPIGDQVASLHGAVTIGTLHLRLRQDDPFVIAGDGFPHSGQMTATDDTGGRLQMEAARWRYVYRLFLAGNRGVLPDASSQSRPHVQR